MMIRSIAASHDWYSVADSTLMQSHDDPRDDPAGYSIAARALTEIGQVIGLISRGPIQGRDHERSRPTPVQPRNSAYKRGHEDMEEEQEMVAGSSGRF